MSQQKLKIALIGYGKMGQAIETLAIAKGHEIVLKITIDNAADLTATNLQQCDVAIEFTNPESAVANIKTCIDAGLPVVCGSTGWVASEEAVKAYCTNKQGSLLYASNFSIGVNIFFEINKKLAALMAKQHQYQVSIEEVHHTHKKDAPSGTAISLAQQIIANRTDKHSWTLNETPQPNEIAMVAKRIDPAPGTHFVKYQSSIDDIEIIHTAHSRQGFATGALTAAEFVYNKKGIFTMADVLKDLI
ncbi:4-hydroxy-tetrahydrodipicolinate reductase [Ferruginibacter yonginensis]|uniref:4-hydroxy-tetrahydrodipicolinate reductase n=1 Tax=Ferruginibacter yonginensis TaxID=1310416 RepID=A0ABV8QVL0_9BACT